jgi:hypothetical protein
MTLHTQQKKRNIKLPEKNLIWRKIYTIFSINTAFSGKVVMNKFLANLISEMSCEKIIYFGSKIKILKAPN